MTDNSIIMLLSLCIIILSSLSFFIVIGKRRSSRNLPPGSSGWPVFGETFEYLRANRKGNPQSFAQDRMLKYNSPVFRTSLFGDDVAVFCGAQGNKFLFANENKLVNLFWTPAIRKLFGPCLVNATGDAAKRHRKMLHTFLNPEALLRYVSVMDEVTRYHFSSLWKGSSEGVIKVYPTVKLYAFQLACRLFMSIEDPAMITNLAEEYDVFVKGMIQIPINLPGTRYYKAKKAVDNIRREIKAVTRERRDALAQHKASPSQDLLSHLLSTPDDTGLFSSEEEIVNNILTMIFAGYDTATSTITMVLKHLGESPGVYEDVLREQMGIAGLKEDGDLLQWEDIQKMKVSWNVVCEVLRMKPPVPGNFRVALSDFTYEGYTIPKGWKLHWNTSTTHKDPSFFPKPDVFNPSRFEAPVTPFSYTPFGGGARMCLGIEFARLQILVYMHNLVKDFKWELLIPGEFIKYDPMPVPEYGLPIRIRSCH